jgi:hypothetical protein
MVAVEAGDFPASLYHSFIVSVVEATEDALALTRSHQEPERKYGFKVHTWSCSSTSIAGVVLSDPLILPKL